jgi:hypothetical protein
MTGDPVEITKFAVGKADIRGIHVAIDLPGHLTMGHL